MMNKRTITLGLFLAGSLAFTSMPAGADDILFKARAGDTNFCHLKFPAIQEHTLSWAQPVLKDPGSGDIVDFYGPCNYDPTGENAVERQKRALKRRFDKEYGS